jgi:hypothetical protein
VNKVVINATGNDKKEKEVQRLTMARVDVVDMEAKFSEKFIAIGVAVFICLCFTASSNSSTTK